MISLLIVIPLITATITLFLKKRVVKILALLAAALNTLLSLTIWLNFDLNTKGWQYLQEVSWIPSLGINYIVGLDGLSLPFIFLSCLLTLLALLVEHKEGAFSTLFLVLLAALITVFTALDLILFFIAFELTIIPLFFIIGVWGYDKRRYAALKFLLYSLAGSIFLLLGILLVAFLAAKGGPISFDYRVLVENTDAIGDFRALVLCLGFAIAFLIKLPSVPFHTWLPHAHTQAPTAGSILLAGVLLKMGGYGLIRFNLGLFPEAMQTLQPFLATLAILSLIYGGFVALGQTDLKKLIAYSSVNHMGFVLLGIASMTAFGLHGAVYQMVAHGVITGLLFMLVGMLNQRTHTRTIAAMKGMYTAMPILGGMLWLAMLAGAGIPGLAGFIGEFQALLGAFQNPKTTIFATLGCFGILINAALMLWTIQRVLQGEPTTQMQKDYNLEDLSGLEIAVAIPLIVLAVLWGVWPPALSPFIDNGLQAILFW